MNELEQLRTLDPARDWRPGADDRIAADAFVDRLVSAEEAPRRPAARRRVLIGCAAAAVAVAGAAVVPALLPGGDGGSAAYAAWATPRGVAGPQALTLATDCAEKWGAEWGRKPVASDVVLAEHRGKGFLLLVAKGGGKDLVDCVAVDAGKGVVGAELLDPSAGVIGPAKVLVQSLSANRDEQGTWYSAVVGRATGDVTGVDVLASDGSTVHASLQAGWWAAWWPGQEAGTAAGVRITVHTATNARTYPSADLTIPDEQPPR